jgi:glycosyltransferase involved in cell wall biosynthesis
MRNEFAPLVSVVIPTYNYAHFLAEAIESVLAQTYTNFEIIIVDNFSIDNTAELVSSFLDDRIKFLQFDNGGSIAAARNFGWKNSSGQLVAFLDADDFWAPSKLTEQSRAHLSDETISYHDLKLFGSRNFGRVKGHTIKGDSVLSLLTKGNPLATSSVMVSRHLLDLSGGFPESQDVISAEDLALWLDLGDRGSDFLYIPRTLGAYRIHASSSSLGRSARATKIVIEGYKSRLTSSQLKRLEGWLSYADGLAEKSPDIRRHHFWNAALKASGRFKWRSIVRIALRL